MNLSLFSFDYTQIAAIFDRSGRYVITGSDDRLVKIWSMETAYCLASCRGHEVSFMSYNALLANFSFYLFSYLWFLLVTCYIISIWMKG